jgi:hypothetical protein
MVESMINLTRVTSRRLAAWLVLAVCLLGCGPRGPAVEMVHGVVLLDGQPVEGATVFFSPATGDGKSAAGLPAAGRTGADGSFRLNATGGAKTGAGTKTGDYVVTVVKQETDPLPAPEPGGPPPPPPADMKVRDLLPVVYKSGTTSPLRATVVPGKNTFRFELESSAQSGKPR